MRKIKIASVLISILALASAQRAIAQTSGPSVNIVKLTLHPVATTEPALQYLLLPPMSQRHEGNAAVSWMVVAAIMPPYFDSKRDETPLFKTIDEQLDAPPETFSPSIAAKAFEMFPTGFMDRAARCDTVDWGVDYHAGVNALLPHLNYLRDIADVLALRARLGVSRNDLVDARQALQSGFSMSHEITREPIIVQDLVSCGIAQLMLEDGVQPWITSGGPNLFWSLSSLPSPFIDLAPLADQEQALVPWTDNRLAQALDGTLPPDQWRSTLDEIIRLQVQARYADASTSAQGTASYAKLKQNIYPKARQRLEAKGFSTAKIDAVPIEKAVGEFIVDEYKEQSDDQWKAWSLPYCQAAPLLKRSWQELSTASGDNNPLLSFIPNLFRARATFARLEQHIAVLRVIEALRDYAARHAGLLPKTLDQVTDLPLPNDPVTDQPFTYHLDGQNDGESATIEPAPTSAASQLKTQVKYDLIIAPPGQSITAPVGM